MSNARPTPRPPVIPKIGYLRSLWYAVVNPSKLVNLHMQRTINNEYGLFVPLNILGRDKHTIGLRLTIVAKCLFTHRKYISYIEQCTRTAYLDKFVYRPLGVFMDSESPN